MADGLEMSLDEIIRRKSAARRRAEVRPAVPGPNRRFHTHYSAERTPYSTAQVREVRRASIVPEMVSNVAATENYTKLYISNLDYGVSSGDIKLLFAEEGELKRYCIHYDRNGISKGTAEVIFVRQSDALKAMRKYNNMRLDGKPLQIELVGTNLVSPALIPPFQNSLLGRPNDVHVRRGRVEGRRFNDDIASGCVPRGHEERVHTRSRKASSRDLDDDLRRYHHFKRGRREERGHIGNLSSKDLDDDLERYHQEAMLIKEVKGN